MATLKTWTEEKAAAEKKIATAVRTIVENLEDNQVCTYLFLATQIPEAKTKDGKGYFMPPINSAVQALEIQLAAKVVDREQLIPSRGFWKTMQRDYELTDEQVDQLRTEMHQNNLEKELKDGTLKAKSDGVKGDFSAARAALGAL